MKCIQCGTDNNLRDRKGNDFRCTQCNHPFAFEPTEMGRLQFTDPFFAKVITDLSANNSLHFTPKQLFYYLDRRLKRKGILNLGGFGCTYLMMGLVVTGFFGGFLAAFLGRLSFLIIFIAYNILWIWGFFKAGRSSQQTRINRLRSVTNLQVLGFFLVFFGLGLSVLIDSPATFIWLSLLGVSAILIGSLQRRRVINSPEAFLITAAQMQKWLDDWARVNGSIEKLLPSPEKNLPSGSSADSPGSDVTAYSFDRLVVCQSDAIAQMLISNHFPFENNCAVLSIAGYPHAIFATLMQMLRRNPDLQVFAFHDCSPEGVALVHQLRTDANWFAHSPTVIVDIGLAPRQVLATGRDLFVQNSRDSAQAAAALAVDIRQHLSAPESQWLDAGNFVELESFTPQRLIQILTQAIAQGQLLETESSSLIVLGGGEAMFYGAESFG